jgi:two-component system, OmpR family, sensor histidine kinase KdpD
VLADLELMRSVHRARIGEVLARSVAHALRDATQLVDLIAVTGGRSGDAARSHADACDRLRETMMAQVTALETLALADRERVTPLSVADVCDVAARLARRAIGPSRTTIEVAVPRTLPPAVGIATDISEACYALLLNAVEALMIQGEGRIVVTATVVGDTIQVRIVDDGPGIPAVVRESGQLFAPAAIPATPAKMRGLGLPVARYLARLHGGDVHLEDGVGRGASFVLDLLLWRRSAVATRGLPQR